LKHLGKIDVAETALFVAAVRARESERANPLFRDELSALLSGPEGLARLAKSERDPGSNYRRESFPYLEVRTRYFDDWASRAVRESGAHQLVILGAGMDTRAFRLPWPDDLRLWEVDTPELFSLKEARLESAGVRLARERITVKADLTSKNWVPSLLETGFDRNRSTVWLAEGLFQYLAAADVNQILESASSVSPAGSRFLAEIISEDHLRMNSNRTAMKRRSARGTPWLFGTNDPEALFRRHNWKVDQKVGALEAAISLERWRPSHRGRSLRSDTGPPGASFVSAIRTPLRERSRVGN